MRLHKLAEYLRLVDRESYLVQSIEIYERELAALKEDKEFVASERRRIEMVIKNKKTASASDTYCIRR
jgi:hypothetical protein